MVILSSLRQIVFRDVRLVSAILNDRKGPSGLVALLCHDEIARFRCTQTRLPSVRRAKRNKNKPAPPAAHTPVRFARSQVKVRVAVCIRASDAASTPALRARQSNRSLAMALRRSNASAH